MKYVVLYYSRTGRTRKIAQLIRMKLKADIEEIKDHQKRKGILGFINSGNEAYLKKRIPIEKPQKDLLKYDCVIIGTPVWAGSVSSPVRSFMLQYKDQFKKVAFFCTRLGSDSKSIFNVMEQVSLQRPKAVLSVSARDILLQSHIKAIDRFIRTLKEKEGEK